MFQRLREDIACIRDRDPAARSGFEVLTCYPGLHAVVLHRLRCLVLAAGPVLARPLRLAHRALPHRDRDPSGRDRRAARLHRPRHGRRRRRDRGDRRRLHDLPGRDPRRHLARARRQAPPDARQGRHRRRELAGARRLHGRRRCAHRLERGRRQAGARRVRRRSAIRHASSRPRPTRRARRMPPRWAFRPMA